MSERISMKSSKSIITSDNRPAVLPDNNVLFVCALDLGIMYSGYAYSTRVDPKDIFCPHWNSATACMTHLIPTVILLDEKQNFIAFGFEAEEKYLELDAEEKNSCYFFRRFQMNLYDKLRSGEILTVKTTVSDVKGKELPALDILSHAIKYLKYHMLNEHKSRRTSLEEVDIYWVLTVAAMWDDPGKQFMIQAAEMAGIDNKHLAIVSDPKAAFICCKDLPLEKIDEESDNIDVFSLGQRCLVLDAGDGTIDMTVLEVKSGEELHVLSQASWKDCSGIIVNTTFIQMMIDIVGEEFMDSYCQNNTADYIDLLRQFEMKKYAKSDENIKTGEVNLSVSPTFVIKYKEKTGKDISERVKETRYAKSLKWARDKMRIDKDLFQSFFNASCEKIVYNVRQILSKPEVKGSKILLMVGCFSELTMLQVTIKNAFPECLVVVPHQARLAVLKGAVLFGHNSISDNDRPVIEDEFLHQNTTN